MDRNNFIRASKKIEIQLAAKRMADGMTGVGVKFGINATRTQETLEKYGKGMIDVMKGREVPESVKNAHARAARGPEKRERKQLDLADYLPKKETAKAKTHGEPTKQKEKTKDKELGD